MVSAWWSSLSWRFLIVSLELRIVAMAVCVAVAAAATDSHKSKESTQCGPKRLPYRPWVRKVLTWVRQQNRWRYQVLVHEPWRLAFCKISKVGNTQFAHLFNALNGLNSSSNVRECCGGWKPQGKLSVCYLDSAAGRYNVTAEGIHASWYAAESGKRWTLAAFIRDPLERFLAAFLNSKESWRKYWYSGSFDGPALTQSQDIEAFEAFTAKNLACKNPATASCLGFSGMDDPHWRLQVSVLGEDCGFKLDRINFWGSLHFDRTAVNMQVRYMLAMASGLDSWRSALHADKFFPAVEYASTQATQCSDATHEQLLTYYRKRETVDAVLAVVERDYHELKLPVPTWVNEVPYWSNFRS